MTLTTGETALQSSTARPQAVPGRSPNSRTWFCGVTAMLLLTSACSRQSDADSGDDALGGASQSGASATSNPARGGDHSRGGAGGGENGGSSSISGGTSSAVASSAVTNSDSAEKGLCQIAIGCNQKIVDSPAVLCTFDVKDAQGATVYSDHAAVDLRGRTSLGFPKKNYAIELQTADGTDNPVNLLGMGKEADWVLDGAWVDRSFMRNRLAFGLFRDAATDRWAPRGRYCELTLNGSYAGLYVLLEKIKRDDDRVSLPDDDGTGSTFIVKQDDDGTLKLSIGVGNKWKVVYPNSNVITATQTQGVQSWLDGLGTAMRSSNAGDTLGLFNAAAITDWILIEELMKNVDAYNLSVYFVRNGGAPVWVVPWDLDLSCGQPTIRGASSPNEAVSGWVHERTNLISKLEQNTSLRQSLSARWRELRQGVLSDQAVFARLDGYASVLTVDVTARNFALWPIQNVDFTQFYDPYSLYRVSSYDDEVAHLRSWIQQRLAWLDANIDSYPSQ